MSQIKKMLYLLNRKQRGQAIVTLILIVLGAFFELIGIAIVLPIIDLAMVSDDISTNMFAKIVIRITGKTDKESVLIFLICLTIIIYILKSLYLIYMNSHLYVFSMNVKRELSVKLLNAYYCQPYEFFLKNNSSDLIRAVSYDTGVLYDAIINILRIISSGLTAISIIVFLFIANPLMTLVVAGLIVGCAMIIFFVFNKKYQYYGKVNQRLNGTMSKDLRQSFEAVKEIKVMGIGPFFVNSYEETYKKQCKIMNKYQIYNTLPKYLVETVSITGILAFLGINIIFNSNYIALVPQLATFCVAAYKLLPSINGISSYTNNVAYSIASIDLIYGKILESEKMIKEKLDNSKIIKSDDSFKEIEVKNVLFRYDGADTNVIENANFVVKKGQSVAFVGPSGGGKTTLVDIILGLLKPLEGQVTVNNKNIEDDIDAWCKNIGYIPQVIYLTDDTIRNNIAFGIPREEIDDEQVWKALEEAQLKEFVESLPKKLDTEVGERGARISGGQRQRIGIARALYRNPEILVFDEATSALDNETEKEVMKAIEGLQGTKTMIMIAHRLSTIENCDVIYKVENGTVEKAEFIEIISQDNC